MILSKPCILAFFFLPIPPPNGWHQNRSSVLRAPGLMEQRLAQGLRSVPLGRPFSQLSFLKIWVLNTGPYTPTCPLEFRGPPSHNGTDSKRGIHFHLRGQASEEKERSFILLGYFSLGLLFAGSSKATVHLYGFPFFHRSLKSLPEWMAKKSRLLICH